MPSCHTKTRPRQENLLDCQLNAMPLNILKKSRNVELNGALPTETTSGSKPRREEKDSRLLACAFGVRSIKLMVVSIAMGARRNKTRATATFLSAIRDGLLRETGAFFTESPLKNSMPCGQRKNTNVPSVESMNQNAKRDFISIITMIPGRSVGYCASSATLASRLLNMKKFCAAQ